MWEERNVPSSGAPGSAAPTLVQLGEFEVATTGGVWVAAGERLHYCILRKVKKSEGETPEAFEARRLKQEYFVKDLKRFGIQTVFVSEYEEITNILQRIENRYKRTSILLSGAAHDYGLWTQGEASEFLHKLSCQIVSSGNRVITGFGLGVGSAVINGALASIEA